ncbi:MAG: protoporphyrinogen oxidase [Omnitrophica bacterium RIFOXYB12_FULL_50_7]|nr:MAG: protoporphyrinogen oxidase [Omnitrophica bacterium RIFOXYB12_FULL_50_7]
MATPRKVLIIGGGISGLATAYHLSELARQGSFPLEITLLESKPRFGGVIETRSREGFLLEGGPDSFISEKPAALELSRRLGMVQEVIGTNEKFRRSFIYKKGRLVQVPEGFYLIAPSQINAFIRTPLLSWATKFRMGCELFIPKRLGGGDESVASFVRRRFGENTLREVAQPMIGGIYTADPEYLSLEATMPQFLEMERTYGSVIRGLFARKKHGKKNSSRAASGPRYSLFLSYRQGMEQLTRTIVSQLPEVRFKVSSAVMELKHSGRWEVMTQQGEKFSADAVCLALPAQPAARLLGEVAPSLARDLAAIPYESVATVNCAYRRTDIPHSLEGFGFVVPAFTQRKIVACSFSSVKFAGRAPEGMVLLRAFVGGALHREVYALEDDAMVRTVTEELRHYLGVETRPVFTSVSRYPQTMPQYQVGHLHHVASIRSQLAAFPGLYLAGNAYNGIGVPDCIKSAEFAASAIVKHIQPELAHRNVSVAEKS